MKNGEPLMEFGNMNGGKQAYSHVTHLVNTIDLGFNPQASADAARYTHSQSATGPRYREPRKQSACVGWTRPHGDGTPGEHE